MISGAPVVMGEKLFVQSEDGELATFMVRMPEPEEEDDTDSDGGR